MEKVLDNGAEVLVSTVVAFELWYGVARSTHQEANARRIETFFAGPISLVPFDDEDAVTAGQIRATLEAEGKPIGAYDTLIAGQALRRKLILITANAREFSKVRGLAWQDWATPHRQK